MRRTLKLVDDPTAPKRVADMPAPPRRRLGDVLDDLESPTDEEMPSLGMAIIGGTQRTKELIDAGRARNEATAARSRAIDAFEWGLDEVSNTWGKLRAKLATRR